MQRWFLLAFVFFILSNCTLQVEDEYANKLENFEASLKNRYGLEYQKRIKFHELNSFRDSITGLKVGNYRFKDYYGNEIELLRGSKPVLLESFASWCAPCISSIPALNQLSKDYPNVRFVIVAHDKPDKLEKYAKKINSGIHLVPSAKEVNANNFIKLQVGEFKSVFPYPTSFFIDGDGIIQNTLIGAPRAGNFGSISVTEEEVLEANMLRLSRELDKLVAEQ